MENTVWGEFPENLKSDLFEAVKRAWQATNRQYNHDVLQNEVTGQLRQLRWVGPDSLFANKPVSELAVEYSHAQIDIVIDADPVNRELGQFLIHVGGHQQPRHEKELLEFMSVALANPKPCLAIWIVCSDNKLSGEGDRSSFSYCTGALLCLADPILKMSKLQGILVIGLP